MERDRCADAGDPVCLHDREVAEGRLYNGGCDEFACQCVGRGSRLD